MGLTNYVPEGKIAERLRKSLRTMRRWREKPQQYFTWYPTWKRVGRSVYYEKTSLYKWLRDNDKNVKP
jgi:hypothetical protein